LTYVSDILSREKARFLLSLTKPDMLFSSGLINPLNEAKLNNCGLLYHSVPSNDISPVS
jgi:hypothetical protein